MASYAHRLNLNLEYNAMDEINDDVIKIDTKGNKVADLTFDQVRKGFQASLNLNKPTMGSISGEMNDIGSISGEMNDIPLTYFNKVEKAKRKSPMECADADKTGNLDLNLNEAVTSVECPEKDDTPNHHLSGFIASSISSPSPSVDADDDDDDDDQTSCMSKLDLNMDSPEVAEAEDDDGLPSRLVVMGCRMCMIYVMVLAAEPRCLQCDSTLLIDPLREYPAKRRRRN